MQKAVQPFSPIRHCPQCDGAIDPRCVRATPVRAPYPYPRRHVEGWCEFCLMGWRMLVESREPDRWEIVNGVTPLRGELSRSIRTYAERQTNVIRKEQAA